ncbi:MAG: hypothetical protein QOF63_736 [Thermoanaerobaculia bacterium]|nr:hypothetical protein [Thermoanaerobaculia bacterium]
MPARSYLAALLITLICSAAAAQITANEDRVQSAMSVAPLSCSSAPPLSCGGSITASPSCLSDVYFVDLYTFSATAGQTLTLTVSTATGYQVLVTVQNTAGILTSNHGVSPVTLTYTFPASGTYYIGLGYVAQFATGSYTLNVACGSTSSCQSSGTINLNSSVSGQLTSANGTGCLGGNTYSAVYGFTGTKDVPLLITFTSSFAPYVELEPPSFDTGIWRSSKTPGSVTLTYLPQVSGNNWIYVTSNTSTPTTGSYTVRVETASIDPCRRRSVSH